VGTTYPPKEYLDFMFPSHNCQPTLIKFNQRGVEIRELQPNEGRMLSQEWVHIVDNTRCIRCQRVVGV
jgi:hypothetical protein